MHMNSLAPYVYTKHSRINCQEGSRVYDNDRRSARTVSIPQTPNMSKKATPIIKSQIPRYIQTSQNTANTTQRRPDYLLAYRQHASPHKHLLSSPRQ